MRSYPIWHDVTACNYKGSKSFGSLETSSTTINVGSSSRNSETLVTHTTTKRIEGDYTVFRFGVDLHDGTGLTVIKTRWMHTKRREWFDTDPRSVDTGGMA